MLPLSEQILVLLLDEKREEFLPIGKYFLARALVGAVLMDLAFEPLAKQLRRAVFLPE